MCRGVTVGHLRPSDWLKTRLFRRLLCRKACLSTLDLTTSSSSLLLILPSSIDLFFIACEKYQMRKAASHACCKLLRGMLGSREARTRDVTLSGLELADRCLHVDLRVVQTSSLQVRKQAHNSAQAALF